MKIYTKTGDQGETSLYSGQRVPKHDPFMHALGTVDECNCAIGAAIGLLPDRPGSTDTRQNLISIQHALFDLGAALATPLDKAKEDKIRKTRFNHEAVEQLEHWIDEIEGKLPELKTFILPGGHPAGAMLHMARCICRRAERHVVPMHRQQQVQDNVLIYLNRLSDYLFMVARYVNHLSKVPETSWEHHKMG